jgi:plastocyanin
MKIQLFIAKLLLLKLAIISVALLVCVLALPTFAQVQFAPNQQFAPNPGQTQSQFAPNQQFAPNPGQNQSQFAPNQQFAPNPGQSQLAPAFQIINIVFGASSQKLAKYYDPQSVNVKAGTSVTWINNDNAYHTVTFVTKDLYDSGIILPRHFVSNLFFQLGTFDYYCKIHPYMTGQLTIF